MSGDATLTAPKKRNPPLLVAREHPVLPLHHIGDGAIGPPDGDREVQLNGTPISPNNEWLTVRAKLLDADTRVHNGISYLWMLYSLMECGELRLVSTCRCPPRKN